MPWTAKQLKLFRAAAHNPAIAKSSGIKQSDAERMSKEGLKKMAAGGRAMINKQDTRHGKMDMPYSKLNRLAGFNKGGVMKKRRFNGEEESYVDDSAEPEVERKYFASGVSAKDREYTPPKAAAKSVTKPAAKKASDYGDEGDRLRARKGDYDDMFKGISRASRLMRRDDEAGIKQPSSAKAEPESKSFFSKFRDATQGKTIKQIMAEQRASRTPGYKKGGLMRSKRDIGKDQMSMAPYNKGGKMKESKAMMKKEIGFMQKKGAPASMIKHEKAEMKGYARGGGVESRGKTKGTIIKMAAGGSVRAHGEHSIQKKGHTRGKMC